MAVLVVVVVAVLWHFCQQQFRMHAVGACVRACLPACLSAPEFAQEEHEIISIACGNKSLPYVWRTTLQRHT